MMARHRPVRLAVGYIFVMVLFFLPLSVEAACVAPFEAAAESSPSSEDLFGDTITRSSFGCDFMFHGPYFEKAFDGKGISDLLEMHIDSLKDLGIGIVGMNLNWREIELSPPRDGAHSYNWAELDKIMKTLHGARIGAKLQIFPSPDWASRVPASNLNRAGPVKESALSAWKSFVQALVERYDGDGEGDAFPGEFQVLRIINVSGEVEAPNNWQKLGGTPEEYDEFLSRTTRWIKEACDSVIVARAATNFANGFDHLRGRREIEKRLNAARNHPAFKFFLKSMEKEDEYDLLGFQINYHWSGIEPQIEWIRSYLREKGYSKPIFANHTRTTLTDSSLERTLLDPAAPGYSKAREEYYADQASHTVKKLTLCLAQGLRCVLLAIVVDACHPKSPMIERLKSNAQEQSWVFTGLFEGKVPAGGKSPPIAPKPVFYSYRLLIEKLIGADRSVEALELGANVHCFKFRRSGKSVFVLWYEDATNKSPLREAPQTTVKLPLNSSRARTTWIVTGIGQTNPEATEAEVGSGHLEVRLSSTPLIVEEL